MIKFLFTFLLTFTAFTVSAKDIILTDKNTISLRAPFFSQFTNPVKHKLQQLSNKLDKNDTIYLFLSSPGGSIVDGIELIRHAAGVPQEVATVTTFAASMGFMTVQSLGPRYIMNNGILMAHRARGGVYGQIPGEIDTRYRFWRQYIFSLEKDVAERIGTTFEKYRKVTYNELWVNSKVAVKNNLADAVVNVRCGRSLDGTYKDIVNTFFGPVAITWSKCPLISSPLSVKFNRRWDFTENGTKFKRLFTKMLYNKVDFVRQDHNSSNLNFVQGFIE